MLLRGILTSRSEGGDELHEADMFFVFDGTQHHNTGRLSRCFINSTGDQIDKQCKTIYLNVDEDSLRSRRGCLRPGASFDQVEFLSLITRDEFCGQVPACKGLHYKGTNMGNSIVGIEHCEQDQLWKLSCKKKIELMGPFRVAVGGKTEGEEIGRGTKRKGPDTIEPVFWHSRPKIFFQEVIHRFKPKAIIDCGMSDGILALECTKMRIPYIGFGLTEIHVELLKAHMVQELMKSFHTEGEKEYDPELALLFKPEKGPVEAQPKKRLATSLVSGGASSSGGSVKAGADNSAGTSAGSLLANFKRKLEDLKNKTTTAADGEAEAPDSPE